MIKFEEAKRVKNLPAYLFARIEKIMEQKRAEGADIISLGIGDPDRPTPQHIIDTLNQEAANPLNHQYPSSVGMLSFRQTVADWYQSRFGVTLDPKTEVVNLIGSKEGIGHIAWCFLDPGDISLVPDPAYPVYEGGTILAGAKAYYMPLKAENNFLPKLADIPTETAKAAKMMFLNYPNNPTGATATPEFFQEMVAFAKEYQILVCHDAPYTEIAFDGFKPISFMQTPGAKEVGIEFHSVSKTYNMTGWRIGWAVGNPQAIDALGRLKSNIDSGQFQALQYAAMTALTGDQSIIAENNQIYQERRDILVDGLNSIGWNLAKPQATIYIWAPVPAGHTSESFAELVLDKAGVVITPGSGYGPHGAGYFRMSLTLATERLKEAIERIKNNVGPFEF